MSHITSAWVFLIFATSAQSPADLGTSTQLRNFPARIFVGGLIHKYLQLFGSFEVCLVVLSQCIHSICNKCVHSHCHADWELQHSSQISQPCMFVGGLIHKYLENCTLYLLSIPVHPHKSSIWQLAIAYDPVLHRDSFVVLCLVQFSSL